MKEQIDQGWVNRRTLIWLFIAQGFAILPLFFHLPFWIPLVWIVSLYWRIQIYRGAWAFPSSKTKAFLGFGSIAALVVSYSGAFAVEPLVAFLVISFVLKLIEMRTRQDALLVIYVGFIAVASHFLFFQTAFMAVYSFGVVLCLVAAWNSLYSTSQGSVLKQLKFSSVILVQSIPLMIVMFIVMPRLATLWHVPIPKTTGVTGFGDSMSPGDFSQLSQSSAVAFRVSFDESNSSPIPERKNWYWRGLVLDSFNGRTWRHNDRSIFVKSPSHRGMPDYWRAKTDQTSNLRYQILMEPHQKQWLFTLMAPVHVNSQQLKIHFTPNILTQSVTPIASRTQYSVVSNLNYEIAPDGMSQWELRRNLRLPGGNNPRAIALAEQWRQQGLGDEAIINKALEMYNASFTYTLQPPLLGQNSVDDFLFRTQRGFCEHFSSSFTLLMRAAGIPARVVVGYQGGELNPLEKYIIVRQSDAHAWSEVWLEEQGWVRIDPTAAVSPLRVEQGLEQSLDAGDAALVSSVFSGRILNTIQLRIDAFSYTWHLWVLGYDTDKQAGLFKSLLGGTDVWRIALFFVLSVVVFLAVYFLALTRRRRKELYPEQKLYDQHLSVLAKKGFNRKPGETPLDFARRVAQEKPALEVPLMQIAEIYCAIAFAGQASRLQEFKSQILSFKI